MGKVSVLFQNFTTKLPISYFIIHQKWDLNTQFRFVSDIDECATMPDLCRNGRCINTLGSYRCVCNRGFKPDASGSFCLDINECQQTPSPCKFSCQNTEGSFICSCPAGYVLNPDGVSCRDIDECSTGSHICQHECINTQGSYKCSCEKGYKQIGDKCLGELILFLSEVTFKEVGF